MIKSRKQPLYYYSTCIVKEQYRQAASMLDWANLNDKDVVFLIRAYKKLEYHKCNGYFARNLCKSPLMKDQSRKLAKDYDNWCKYMQYGHEL